jgi:predicted AAA+ superfamily ATPase
VAGGISAERSATDLIWTGSFPEIRNLRPEVIPGWMQGYVNTYLQRDVRQLIQVRDETRFARFLSLCASLTGQECNYSQIGRDIEVSTPTAIQWLSILRATYQWFEVPAFSSNHIKRLSEKPKGYFCDTGLAAYLMRLSSAKAVQGHPAYGALFETLIVMELYKQALQQSLPPSFYHYRLHSGAEIDLILEKDGLFFPVEIKAGTKISSNAIKNIEHFRESIPNAAEAGLIIYSGTTVQRLTSTCTAVPFDLLL